MKLSEFIELDISKYLIALKYGQLHGLVFFVLRVEARLLLLQLVELSCETGLARLLLLLYDQDSFVATCNRARRDEHARRSNKRTLMMRLRSSSWLT